MEKPVERNLQNARDLVDICAQNDVRLGIMLQHRVRPVFEQLRRFLEDLGDIHVVEVSVPWWRDQTYYDAPGRGTYARDGGGVMISQAIHSWRQEPWAICSRQHLPTLVGAKPSPCIVPRAV